MRGLPDSFGALRERPFRLLWLGQGTSAIGDAMTGVALTFAVLGTSGSATDLGIVLGAFTIAHAVFILAGGVWSDRLPRRLVMLAADIVRATVQATLAVLLITGNTELWHFVAIAFVTGAAESFFGPASTGLIPQTISPARLQQANGLIALTRSGSWIFGPALSGVLVATVGAGWVFAIDAASFLVSALFLSLLRVPLPAVPERQSFLADLAHGWREVRSRQWVWASLIAFGIGNMAWGAMSVLGPLVAEQEFSGPTTWGLLSAAGGIGGVVGGVLVLRWRPRRPLLTSHLVILVFGVQLFAFAVPIPVPALMVLSFLGILAVVVANTIWETVLQAKVPRASLSRVSSYDYAVSFIFMPIGYAIWGPLAAAIGIRTTLILAGAIVIATKLAVVLAPEIRRMGQVGVATEAADEETAAAPVATA
ncbi:MAG: MFS transporter [Gaiellaceae bacterium MAG52_C11]|nr:MFS transporter [Candidatus Gaiellasilicea maunaloa]